MENKKSLSFPLIICTIIIGVALFKQFDFKNLTLDKPWLSAVYGITFAALIYVQIKKPKK